MKFKHGSAGNHTPTPFVSAPEANCLPRSKLNDISGFKSAFTQKHEKKKQLISLSLINLNLEGWGSFSKSQMDPSSCLSHLAGTSSEKQHVKQN